MSCIWINSLHSLDLLLLIAWGRHNFILHLTCNWISNRDFNKLLCLLNLTLVIVYWNNLWVYYLASCRIYYRNSFILLFYRHLLIIYNLLSYWVYNRDLLILYIWIIVISVWYWNYFLNNLSSLWIQCVNFLILCITINRYSFLIHNLSCFRINYWNSLELWFL